VINPRVARELMPLAADGRSRAGLRFHRRGIARQLRHRC
jgi:hypothetical protein